MGPPKLDRSQLHKINAHQADHLYFWESSFHGSDASERQNITLQDHGGNDVLTIFALTNKQLAELYLDIARVLGKPPEPTLQHLRQIYEMIGNLLNAVKSNEKQESQWFDSFTDENV